MPQRRIQLSARRRIFVNRQRPLQSFAIAAALEAIPEDGMRMLVFYGPGGAGKTALRQEIEHRVQSDEAAYSHLHMAVLDLHANPDMSPEEAIITLRNQFVRAGVSLPAFDIALALVWQKAFPARRLPPLEQGWLTNRAEDLGEAATELVDAFDIVVDAIPFAGTLRKLGGFAVRKGREQWLSTKRGWLRAFLTAEYESRPATELPELLPTLLAHELNHWRQDHRDARFLLLVDEYEHAVPEAQPGRALHGNSPLDGALRRFLSDTDGLLALFFLRSHLPWEESEHWRQDLQGRQHLLEGLSETDACAWLEEAGIADAALQQAMMRGARESDAEDASIFALFLALQIEHYQALLNAGKQPAPEHFDAAGGPLEERLRQMAARLLRDFRDEALQQLIQRLALLQRFDETALDFMAERLRIPGTDLFERLARLSFLQQDEHGWLTFHRVLATALASTLEPEARRQAARQWFEHFDARGTVKSHHNVTEDTVACLMQAGRLLAWLAEADADTSPMEYALWLEERAPLLEHTGHFAELAILWQLAADLFSASGDDGNLSVSLSKLGDIAKARGDLEQAERLFTRSLKIRERLAEELDTPDAHRGLSISLNKLGDIALARGDLKQAERLFTRSLEIFEHLADELDTPDAHRGLSVSLNKLGDIAVARGNLEQAERLFTRSLEIFERLAEELDTPDAHRDLSVSLNKLGDIAKARGDLDQAEHLFTRSLEIDERLAEELDTPDAHRDLSVSLNKLGGIAVAHGDLEQAERLFTRSLEIDERLAEELDTPDAHRDLSVSLNKLGDIAVARGDLEQAERLFTRSLKIWERLAEELDTPDAHRGLSVPLNKLGDIHILRALSAEKQQGEHKAASALHHWQRMEATNEWWVEWLAFWQALPRLREEAKLKTANELFERSHAIRKQLLQQQDVPDAHRDMAMVLSKLATVAKARGDAAAARAHLQAALPHAQAHAQVGTPDAEGLLGAVEEALRTLPDADEKQGS